MSSTPQATLRLIAASLLTALVVIAGILLVTPSVALSGPRIVSTAEPAEEEPINDVVVDAEEVTDDAGVTPAEDDAVAATIVVSRPAQAAPRHGRQARVVAQRQPDVTGLELGIRVGTLAAGDDWIDPDGTANYGGFGMALRWRFDNDWSLELGFDGVHRATDSESIAESRYLFNLGALYYLGDVDWWQTYISFGFMGSDTELSGANADAGSYGEAGVYGGFGADFYLDDWRLNTEIRLAGLGREEEEYHPLRPEDEYLRTAPDGRGAVQWFFGALYSF